MRNLKKHIIIALSVLAISAGAMVLGNHVSAAELAPKDPAGPVSNVGRDYKIALKEADSQGNHNVVHKAAEEKPAEDKADHPHFEGKDGKSGERPEGRHHFRREDKDHHFEKGEQKEHRFEKEEDREEHKEKRDGWHRRDDRRGPDGDRGPRFGKDGDSPDRPDGERHHMKRGDRRGPDGEGRHMRREHKGGERYGERRIHRDGERRHDSRYRDRHFAGPRSEHHPALEDGNF